MRIAIIGARSIPARWGGYETAVSEIAPRLASFGHQVTVYCRPKYAAPERPSNIAGVEIRYLGAIGTKSLESLSHEALCTVDAVMRSYDIVYVLGLRASAVHLLQRIRRRPLLMNTDGLDWQRRKWGRLAQAYLRLSEAVAARWTATHLICDSRAIGDYFYSRYRKRCTYLTYGGVLPERINPDPLLAYGLTPDGYYLVVARMEPENNGALIVEEFLRSEATRPIVVVGTVNYRSSYARRLRAMECNRVRFLGGVYEPGHIESLYANCRAYIHGHEVGGTNPALLHAMGCGSPTVALDVPYNREVLDGAGLYFSRSSGDLAARIVALDQMSADSVARFGAMARERVRRHYDWDDIAAQYDRFLATVLSA